jgi:hypothetical protein
LWAILESSSAKDSELNKLNHLACLSKNSSDSDVRKAAVGKIGDPEVLASIAKSEPD